MFITTTHNGRSYCVPATGRDHNLGDALTAVPDDDHAMAYLMQDGNLAVPGGRYGSDTADCAPIALLLARVMADASGEPTTYHGLDSDMSAVVNSSDDVVYSIWSNRHVFGDDFNIADYFDADDIADAQRREHDESLYIVRDPDGETALSAYPDDDDTIVGDDN